MSRRRREKNSDQTPAPFPADLSDTSRRVLLGIITALVVARPLVAGEDPGRLRSPEAISGVILNLLWMIATIGGAVWLARSRRRLRLGGWGALSLHAVAGVVLFITAVAPCYRHPGWLIAWEWATLALAFLLVKNIASDSDPKTDTAGGLIAAVMATGAMLAVHALYQQISAHTSLPPAELPLDPTSFRAPDSDFLRAPVESALSTVRGTFARSDTLVAAMLFIGPLLVAFGLRDRTWKSRTSLGLALLIGIAAALALREYVANRPDGGLKTSFKIIGSNPILGVGPGNFDRYSPKAQPAELPEVLFDPGNAHYETLATGGILLYVAVCGVILAAVFALGRRFDDNNAAASAPEVDQAPRWEFYLGGVFGLLLGLLLRLIDQPAAAAPQAIVHFGVAAIVRSLVWFLSFALFEGMPMRSSSRRLAVLIGFGLLNVFALVSVAPMFPAILQMIVVVIAAICSGAAGDPIAKPSPVRWIPVPIMCSVAIVNLLLVCDPIYQSASRITAARRSARLYPTVFAKAESAPPGIVRDMQMQGVAKVILGQILHPLEQARQVDPYDSTPPVEWSSWMHVYWKLQPDLKFEEKLAVARKASERDPFSVEPLAAELQLRLTFMRLDPRHFRPKPGAVTDSAALQKQIREKRAEHRREAEALIERIISLDPALVAVAKFRLAQTLILIGDPEAQKEGIAVAESVWQLEESAPGPRWKLSREQRRLVRTWLKLAPEEGATVWVWVPLSLTPYSEGIFMPIVIPPRHP